MRPARENLTLVQGETLDRVIRLCSLLRSVSDASISISDATLVSRSANFDASDVGRTVMVLRAGAGGNSLIAKIASVTAFNTVELDTVASFGVTKAKCHIFIPTDLTGYTIGSDVRESDAEDAALVISLTVTFYPLEGKIVRSIAAEDSILLPVGLWFHDLRLTDSLDAVSVRTRGVFAILPRITQ